MPQARLGFAASDGGEQFVGFEVGGEREAGECEVAEIHQSDSLLWSSLCSASGDGGGWGVGGPCALDGGVGVGVQDGGDAGVGAVVADLQWAGGRHARVVAEGDRLANEERIDFVEATVQADGAVVHDAALDLEQKHLIEIVGGIEVADLAGAQRPLVERGVAVQPAVGPAGGG